MKDGKLLAIFLITAAVIIGLVLVPRSSPLRYAINDGGQFLVVIMAVIIGLERARFFGFRSALGKALLFISLASLAWGLGTLVMLYHDVVLQVETPPYPYLVDIFYLAAFPLAFYGLYMLLKNITKIGFKVAANLAALPVILLLLYILIQDRFAQGTSLLGQPLSIAYPIGDAIILSFALVILGMIRDSKLSRPIGIICISFIIKIIADLGFIATVSMGTYYVGNWTEMLHAVRFMVLGAGMYFTGDIIGIQMGKRKVKK